MPENTLGQALLNLDRAATPDVQPLTQAVLKRDQRRIRMLAGTSMACWVIGTIGMVSACPFYVMIVAPRLRAYELGRAQLDEDWSDWATVGDWAVYWLFACLFALLLAALSTVLLTLVTRRATLRQINGHLAEISEQLRQMRQMKSEG